MRFPHGQYPVTATFPFGTPHLKLKKTLTNFTRPVFPRDQLTVLDPSRPLGKFADDFAVSMQVEEIVQPVAPRTGEVSLPGLILLPVISCRVAFMDRKRPDPDPPERVTADRWQCFPLLKVCH